MKKIKEFSKVYLEYPDEKFLKDDQIDILKAQKQELQKNKIELTREEIIRRLQEEQKSYTR